MSVLFDGKDYRVVFHKRNTDRFAFVILDPWREEPSLDSPATYENFFLWNNISSIKLKSRRNDWYQGDEIDDALRPIFDLSSTMRLIGFGGSMGAYGLVNHADAMGLHTLIAFAPQFSIDEAEPPFETRWRRERSAIDFKRHRVATTPKRASGYILYDPTTIDAQHAGLIRLYHDLVPVPLSYSNHFPIALLQQCRLLEPMLMEIAEDRFDLPDFMRRLRTARRSSSWYWFHLSLAMMKHNRPDAALRAARLATELPDWQPIQTAWHLADLLARTGRYEEAIATLAPYASQDDDFGAHARDKSERWRAELVRPSGRRSLLSWLRKA